MQPEKCIKSLVFKVDEELVMILVRGDHEVNDIKVKNVLNAKTVELAEHVETEDLLSCSVGSLGPIGVADKIKVYADNAVEALVNAVCGANRRTPILLTLFQGAILP